MAHGVTLGLIATIMEVQQIFTVCLSDRKFQPSKMIGLGIALSGLIILVQKSLSMAHIAPLGMMLILAVLLCMTFGSILQKNIDQPHAQVLPLQYQIALLMCVVMLPFEQLHLDMNFGFIDVIIFSGLFISVIAQILLYRLLRAGNMSI